MRVLLDAGADQDVALIEAAANGLIELVRELLARGADVHVCQGMALVMAAANGHTETVKTLLAAGADAGEGRARELA
jgi:ankyrin repeat protein